MRLWHYKLIPFLPNSQLVAQWRELNSIFVKQPKHILINYVYEYPKEDLMEYTIRIMSEMERRNISIKSSQNYYLYFGENGKKIFDHLCLLRGKSFGLRYNPFPNHHTNRYLRQCFYNLQEKYDRGQKDFTDELYDKLEKFVQKEGVIETYKVFEI